MGKVHFYNENFRFFHHIRHPYSINCNKTVIDKILDNTVFNFVIFSIALCYVLKKDHATVSVQYYLNLWTFLSRIGLYSIFVSESNNYAHCMCQSLICSSYVSESNMLIVSVKWTLH